MKMRTQLTRTCGHSKDSLKREVYNPEHPHQKIEISHINNQMIHLKLRKTIKNQSKKQ
jgi:hypothetical protein